MNRLIKIGIQRLHQDELLTLKELFRHPLVTIYFWQRHKYDLDELSSCDFLVLFAKKHWKYLKFNKPYFLILADYVTDKKIIDLAESRKLSLTGFRYYSNPFFKGYLCGSQELLSVVHSNNIKGIFYYKKYPFHTLYNDLRKKEMFSEPMNIVTLINHYKRTASKFKWAKDGNSYKKYNCVVSNVPNFNFIHYGVPHNYKTFEDSTLIQYHARYTLHIKYWGHVCNAVVKSLALGVPVIMDEMTFQKGRYKAYIRNGENGLIFNNEQEIINYLKSPNEVNVWRNLKKVCTQEAPKWHFPYSEEEKDKWIKLLENS